jgi:hypothetical protein
LGKVEGLQNSINHDLIGYRLRSRSEGIPRVTRGQGQRQNLHSRLQVLSSEQIELLAPVRVRADKSVGGTSRCGPSEFGCELRTIELKVSEFPEFSSLCEKLISDHGDERRRRVSSCFIATYLATKTCSTRDNRVMLAVHRDSGKGDDMSLIFGLSSSQEYSGGVLRVATTRSGNMTRRRSRSDRLVHKYGTVTYDITLGRCCVLLDPEHSVHRLHWGKRSVVIVTAKPIRSQE